MRHFGSTLAANTIGQTRKSERACVYAALRGVPADAVCRLSKGSCNQHKSSVRGLRGYTPTAHRPGELLNAIC